MKAIDVIKNVCVLLGRDELIDSEYFEQKHMGHIPGGDSSIIDDLLEQMKEQDSKENAQNSQETNSEIEQIDLSDDSTNSQTSSTSEVVATYILTDKDEKDLDKMLKCLNLVLEEIATSYIPIYKSKKVETVNGSINLFSIDDNILEVVSVRTLNGRNVRYKILADKLICLADKVEIIYKVYPNEVYKNSECESFGGKLSPRVLAYGVASEFCFLNLLYDDSMLWENRFKNALFDLQRKKGEIKLKKRGWY